MAGAAAPSALSGTETAARFGRFDVTLAMPGDYADIRRMLREPLPGSIAVSLEREPDGSLVPPVEGDVYQTLVARDRLTNRVAAIGSRSVRELYLNGRPARVGYLGQLRIASGFRRSRALLDEGFAFCRELHDAGDARVYLTSVVADNDAAQRLLQGTHSRFAPRFTPIGRMTTFVLTRRTARSAVRLTAKRTHPGVAADVELREGTRASLPDLAACLARHGQRYQFSPCWRSNALCSAATTPGLEPEHFLAATRRGQVVGCIACWDQRRFKQVVVRGYAPRLHRWRFAINLTAPVLGMPRLPATGRRLEFGYLSHFAVDDDDIQPALALVDGALQRLPSDMAYAVIGLPSSSPIAEAVRRGFSHREYGSILFCAYWPDGASTVQALDGRLSYPEVAIL